MAALDDLISQIPDESLRERIRAEVKRANRQKKFGLVFEEHLPEATPLYDIPVKRGSVVATKDGQVTDIYYVEKIEDGQAACFHKATKERVVLPVDALVCVAQFGEPIYPYLQPLDTVCNAAGQRPVAHADRGGQLPCAPAAGIPLCRKGGLYLHRPAL